MRFISILGLALILATPVMAQTPPSSTSPASTSSASPNAPTYNHIFGQIMCRNQIPCPGSTGDDSSYATTIGKIASSCVNQHFHIGDATLFDNAVTLDSNNCLPPPHLSNSSFSPSCCVVATANETICDIQCQLLSK